MDLMTESTSYAKLQKKYRGFGAPTVRIYLDGVEITEKLNAGLSNISVDLTAETPASGCSFDVVGEYDAKNTAFYGDGAAKYLHLGAKVEVELGYIETVTVFCGLVAEVEYVMDNEDSPYIHVECMDAKCLLMKQQRLGLFSRKSVTDAIGGMMGAQPFSDYIEGRKIDPSEDTPDMLPAAEDDYQFAVRYAGRMGYEFFIIQGVAYFRKAPSSYSSIMSLSPDTGLLSVKQSLRGMSLYKKTLVAAINPADNQPVVGEAVLTGKFGSGSGASRMLGASQKVLFDYGSESAEQAEKRARVLMQAARGGFGRLMCKCVGIPELVPGRSITIDGISPDADKEHYILSVRHTIDERGFFTNLEARMDVL
jgi:phage protein D